jgi:hypothetical protein
MVTIQQGNGVAIQSITDKQGHLPAQDIGGSIHQSRGALLGSGADNNGQNQSVL